MSLDALAQVAALVARYDDDAWIALANRGLLRRARKDLEVLDVHLTSPESGAEPSADAADERATPADDSVGVSVGVAVGDHRVRIPASGPAHATCTCPSPVLCQHVITACLWLTVRGGELVSAVPAPADAAAPVEPAREPSPHPGDVLHADLMAMDAATLTRHGGLTGYRWAHRFLDDAEEPPSLRRGEYLTIAFARPALTVRYLGGGLDGLVLDQDVPDVPRYRVAAVLAWQRAHGLTLPAPPAPRAAGAGATETAATRTDSRARLRPVVAALLRDLVAVGVSHPSRAIHERLLTTATWAQGVAYHRLALLLRRIADHVDLMLVRSAAADDLELLNEVALAHALVAALDVAAGSGHEPATLVGRARTSYDPVRSLELVGLGGVPWRTGSGYCGLTCVFFSPTRRHMYTWTDARPEALATFDPRGRWQQPAPWTGLASPSATAGRRVVLTNALVSGEHRLSGVESTSATVTSLDGDELAELLPVRSSWAELVPSGPPALSDPWDPAAAWAVLRPTRVLPARWDAAAQTLSCVLLDTRGDSVTLDVPWSRLNAHAIERLESLPGRLRPGALVVARVVRSRGSLVGQPLSVVTPGASGSAARGSAASTPLVDSLHFDRPPDAARSALVARLLDSGTPDQDVTEPATDLVPTAVPPALAALRTLVERQAQRGSSGAAPGLVLAGLNEAHGDLRRDGFAVFVDRPGDADPAESMLRSLYLVSQAEAALGV